MATDAQERITDPRPWKAEVALWAYRKRQAEARYLAAVRCCDERIFAAVEKGRAEPRHD